MAKKVGVVTVTFNSGTVIDDFMRSMLAQTHVDFILYIIDNASIDDTLSRIPIYDDPRIVVISNHENVGVAAGNNQGIKASLNDNCNYVLLLNNDTEFESCLIEKLIDEMVKYNCDMITPKIYYYDKPQEIWCAGGHFNKLRGYATMHDGENQLDNGQFNVARRIEYAPTCCLLAKRSVFEKVGLMDEKYFCLF